MKTKSTQTREKETRQALFLAAVMNGASVAEAAAHAGINRRTAYDWKEQPSFAKAWEETIAERNENLLSTYETELHQRALDRNDHRSYLLLIFLLKRLDPNYKENYRNETKIVHETVREIDFNFSDEDAKEAMKILQDAVKKPQP